MGWKPEENMSDDEWELVLRVQRELGLTIEELREARRMVRTA